jgi:hypothetical protein
MYVYDRVPAAGPEWLPGTLAEQYQASIRQFWHWIDRRPP